MGWAAALPAWDGPSTLVLAFADAGAEEVRGLLRELADTYPTSLLMGCSTAGTIVGDTIHDDGLAVTVVRFAHTTLALRALPVASAGNSFAVGRALGSALAAEPELRSLFVLSEGLGINGTALVAGLTAACPGETVVTGGLAADGSRFDSTWVVVDGEPRTGHVTAVGLYGEALRVGFGSRGGWSIFGPERVITRAEHNVLYEVDGQPALGLYKKYLGERAGELPAAALLFPLAVRAPGAADRELVRTVLSVDEQTQSLTFAGDIPTGSRARLMRANLERIIDGAQDAAEATGLVTAGAALAIAVSCVGRRLILGNDVESELDAVASALPGQTVVTGFYSYGEIAPVESGSSDLHNQTMTMTTWREAPDDPDHARYPDHARHPDHARYPDHAGHPDHLWSSSGAGHG